MRRGKGKDGNTINFSVIKYLVQEVALLPLATKSLKTESKKCQYLLSRQCISTANNNRLEVLESMYNNGMKEPEKCFFCLFIRLSILLHCVPPLLDFICLFTLCVPIKSKLCFCSFVHLVGLCVPIFFLHFVALSFRSFCDIVCPNFN